MMGGFTPTVLLSLPAIAALIVTMVFVCRSAPLYRLSDTSSVKIFSPRAEGHFVNQSVAAAAPVISQLKFKSTYASSALQISMRISLSSLKAMRSYW